MVKKISFWVITFVMLGALLLLYFGYQYLNPKEEFVLEYLQDHPENTSLSLFEDDQAIIAYNADTVLPIWGIKQILLAAVLSQDMHRGILDSARMVPLTELEKFHFPETDGGAHGAWLNSLGKGETPRGYASLKEVVRGMIHYNSTANASSLTGLLGLKRIHRYLRLHDAGRHSPIYHSEAAIYAGNLLGSNENVAAALRDLSDREYKTLATRTFEAMREADSTGKAEFLTPGLDIQEQWYRRLERANSLFYARLLNDLVQQRFFSREERLIFRELLAVPEELRSEEFVEFGGKSSATLHLFNRCLYAVDEKGHRFAMSVFFDGLDAMSSSRVMKAYPLFEEKILSSEAFRNQVVQGLK